MEADVEFILKVNRDTTNIQQKYNRDTTEIQQRYNRNTTEIQQKYIRNTTEIQQKHNRNTTETQQKYKHKDKQKYKINMGVDVEFILKVNRNTLNQDVRFMQNSHFCFLLSLYNQILAEKL